VADPDRLQSILPSISSREVYVVITPSLGGLNGIAFSSKDTVAVAEYTTSYDFRVLAHEIGHLLDLSHVSDKSNLMFSGSGGTDVTQTQAEKAHQEAVNFLSET
jgi:predicted Zn-dependent protease